MEQRSFYDFVKRNKKEETPMNRKSANAPARHQVQQTAVHMRRPAPQAAPTGRARQLGEANTILAESEEMIANLQEKLKQVFYRFGMAGLERIDEAIIRTCKELMNPGAYRQDEGYDAPAPKRGGRKQQAAQKSAPKRPQSPEEIAAAALRGMAPLNPQKVADVAENNDAANIPVAPAYSAPLPAAPQHVHPAAAALMTPENTGPTNYMSQFEGIQLSPEEMAIIQQGLAQEAAGTAPVTESAGLDTDTLAMLGQALKKN